MPATKYDYIPIEHNQRTIAHVFVAPQELKGLSIGYIDPETDKHSVTIGGEIEIGDSEDGTYALDFEMTITKGAEGELSLGDEEYDLKKGRAFVVKEGYKVHQLRCQTKDEALALLTQLKKR